MIHTGGGVHARSAPRCLPESNKRRNYILGLAVGGLPAGRLEGLPERDCSDSFPDPEAPSMSSTIRRVTS